MVPSSRSSQSDGGDKVLPLGAPSLMEETGSLPLGAPSLMEETRSFLWELPV